ncbi:ATP-binding cassette domain-containing protein [Streptomyces sp. NPDC055103]
MAGAPATGAARQALRRLRTRPAALVSAGVLLLLVLLALAAPLLAALEGQDSYAYHDDLVDSARGGVPYGPFGGASADHWLGVEPGTGRDLFVRLLHGARISLLVAVGATAVQVALGVVIGLAAGLGSRWVDGLLGRITDVLVALPMLVLAIALTAVAPPGLPPPAAADPVDGVSLAVHAGETLGVVGESGSGKTTLGRMLVRLLDPTGGRLRYGGTEIGALSERELRPYRRELQMVFQDPVASLDPRRSVGESIADAPPASGGGPPARRGSATRPVSAPGRANCSTGWGSNPTGTRPTRTSSAAASAGGPPAAGRGSVGIARALAAEPRVVVCDEPVSALDVTTQAQVTALLAELQAELGLGLVFIAHDLAVVRQVSDRVAVMRGGRIVEQGTVEEVYGAPQDPYTRRLLAAVPSLDPVLAAERRGRRQELAAA